MMKIRPKCTECGREIREDFCVIMDAGNDFSSCICLDCRDRAVRNLRKTPRIQQDVAAELDEKTDLTPALAVDIIPSALARALA